MRTYGNYDENAFWTAVDEDFTDHTFHNAIDISYAQAETENVRAVEAGDFTWCDVFDPTVPPAEQQWAVHIFPTGSAYGWHYGHVQGDDGSPLALEDFDPLIGHTAYYGDLLGTMAEIGSGKHLHFFRTDQPVFSNGDPGIDNPLDYIDPDYAPVQANGYTWEFENANPAVFFLPQRDAISGSASWTTYYDPPDFVGDPVDPSNVLNDMLDANYLSGAIDVMYCVLVKGYPQGSSVESSGIPEQIEWTLSRILSFGEWPLFTKYCVDFDGQIGAAPGDWQEFRRFYFPFFAYQLGFFGTGCDSKIVCLTNCNEAISYNGINNIVENCWQTNSNQNFTDETVNPVLAAYPDGPYQLDITSYAFDPSFYSPTNSSCELHNFCPALLEVTVTDALSDGVYYHATWIPDVTGIAAELQIAHNQSVPPGTDLVVTLGFTEEMNTGTGSVSASLGTSSISNGNWTSSIVSNDTWTVEVTMPSEVTDQTYVLSVSASDTDNNDLMDPEGAGTVPGSPTPDTHHAVSIGYPVFAHQWTTTINAPMLSSPKLADIDGDGILDVIIQSSDGYVDILDGSGTSLSGWPVSGGWSSGDLDVKASPSIVNLSGLSTSAPEILAVHPSGCNGFSSDGAAIPGWAGIYGSGYNWHALSSPVAGDFDNDNDFEYLLGRQHGTPGGSDEIFYGQDNTGLSIWSKGWGQDQSVSSTPSLCDVDGDGELEALVITDWTKHPATDDYGILYCLDAATGAYEWSRYPFGMFIWGAVVTGNLDTDPQMEVIASGTLMSNPVTMVLDGESGSIEYVKSLGSVFAGASIGDIDSDGDLDVVVSSSSSGGILYCWDGASGDYLPGFPLSLGTSTKSGVSIGDVDSDGMLEMVIAGKDGKLHVINHDGTEVGGFPVSVSTANALSGVPALGDIDGDGRLEIIFGEEDNSVLHCYEMGENSAYTTLSWPQFQHDAMNTGCFETDISTLAPPTDFAGEGELGGMIFTADLSWILSVNDPDFEPVPTPPADVVAYRIYRKIPPRPVEWIATVSAGVSTYTDVINLMSFFPIVAYSATAWDGVNESELTNWIKLKVFASDNIAAGCPVREIIHSDAIPVSRTHSAILNGTSSVDLVHRNGCRILTDGEYDAAYIPSGSSDCIEIDLGDVCTVRDVNVIRDDMPLTGSPRYELSVNGRSFSSADTGRYIRVYSVAGASEIEVSGSLSEETSALIEIQRGTSGEYRIACDEAGTPLAVSVFDLSGRKVWSRTSSTGEILWNRCSSSGNTVPNGVYLIMVESDDIETFTSKVVVR